MAHHMDTSASLPDALPQEAPLQTKPIKSSASTPAGLNHLTGRRIEDGPIIVGICAMDKKARSKPMTEMLSRLTSFAADGQAEFKVIYFGDEVLLEKPVEEWPLCEALIAFFSKDFPLQKAQQYVTLRRPLVFNDLDKQELLFDRRDTYRILEEQGVPVPTYAIFNAGEANDIDEQEEYLEINGKKIQKPLVEKPVSGEDHNIYLYYPRSLGGGSKRLFRKVGDRSSQFYPDVHNTRITDGSSYIYEELLQTEGTDVKVYTIGPEYAHAEARKSPVVDGKVMRKHNGKEVRFPVILTAAEKEMARKIVLAFGQTVCGFDLLRSNGQSFVCDVNGWSFVKDSQRFWSDAAGLMRQYCLEALAPAHLGKFSLYDVMPMYEGEPFQSAPLDEDMDAANPTSSKGSIAGLYAPGGLYALPCLADGTSVPNLASVDEGELLCMVALTRHGDRTPKQKLKFTTKEPSLLSMITKYGANYTDELKIKKVRHMEELCERIEKVVDRLQAERRARGALSSDDDTAGGGDDTNWPELEPLLTVRHVLKSQPFHGINRKVQLKPSRWVERDSKDEAVSDTDGRDGEPGANGSGPVGTPTEALFILKWGGELTPLGEAQAAALGAVFRNSLFPAEGGGFLRLHSTYRHDLKIYSSDEGRVQMTAAAFARGFLDLEGFLTPILGALVSKNKAATDMLDVTSDAGRLAMDSSKDFIREILTTDEDMMRGGPGSPEAALQLPKPLLERAASAAAIAQHGGVSRQLSQPLPVASYDSSSGMSMNEDMPPPPVSAPVSAPAAQSGKGLSVTAPDKMVSPILQAAPTCSSLLVRSLTDMGNPKKAMLRMHKLLEALLEELDLKQNAAPKMDDALTPPLSPRRTDRGGPPALALDASPAALALPASAASSPVSAVLRELPESLPSPNERGPANKETASMMYSRWRKLTKDFYKKKKDAFDTTKVPDLYDNAMYDMVHNRHLQLRALGDVYAQSCTLASYVVPQEYGVTAQDKVEIGLKIASAMLSKLRRDLLAGMDTTSHEQERVHQLDHRLADDVRSPLRHVRTRLYFTSESHIHSTFNVLRWGHLYASGPDGKKCPSIFSDEARKMFDDMALGYLTHIVFRVLYRKGEVEGRTESYTVQILVSPGVRLKDEDPAAAAAAAAAPTSAAAAAATSAAAAGSLAGSPAAAASTSSASEQAVQTEPLMISSRRDLTLADVEAFLSSLLMAHPSAQHESALSSSGQLGPRDAHGFSTIGREGSDGNSSVHGGGGGGAGGGGGGGGGGGVVSGGTTPVGTGSLSGMPSELAAARRAQTYPAEYKNERSRMSSEPGSMRESPKRVRPLLGATEVSSCAPSPTPSLSPNPDGPHARKASPTDMMSGSLTPPPMGKLSWPLERGADSPPPGRSPPSG